MARLIRPFRQIPHLQQQHLCSNATFHHLLSPSLTVKKTSHCFVFACAYTSNRSVQYGSRGLRLPEVPSPPDVEGEGGSKSSDSVSDSKRSRNQRKREAKRAVRWGMELSSFSDPQIKRILRVASLEREVYEALMLVKRLGPDVREGKRRQYNFIGKLLRDVQPELMDALIHSTKDGDWSRLQAVPGMGTGIVEFDDEESEEETEYEEADEDEEATQEHVDIANRWLDGLINKDVKVTNEVYAVHTVDFDRQELRQLVRKVHAVQERKIVSEENDEAADAEMNAAIKPLSRFLHALAKQILTESDHVGL